MNKTIPNSRWQLGLEIRPLSSGGVSAILSDRRAALISPFTVIEEFVSSNLLGAEGGKTKFLWGTARGRGEGPCCRRRSVRTREIGQEIRLRTDCLARSRLHRGL